MRHHVLSNPFILAASVVLVFGASSARSHGSTPTAASPRPAPHHEAKEPEGELPKTYQQAVDEIDEHAQEIGRLIEAGKLGKLHHEAAVIKRIADHLSPLVAAEGSGVPSDARVEVLGAAKKLSALFTAIDQAGDSGDGAASRKAHADLLAQVAILRKYAPAHEAAVYACPMCPGVSSDKPGRCPKCGMDLVKGKPK